MIKRIALAFLCLAAGCGGGAGGAADGGDGSVAGVPGAPCNPLGSGDCLTPFPSTAFLAEDGTTATGWRVALSEDVLPENDDGVLLDPTFWNRFDGFSAATYLLAYFPETVDPSNLPPVDDPAASLEATSPTVIIEVPSGERVPHFAELDANADEDDDDRQGLILRPVIRLKPGVRYAVGLHRSLGPAVPAGFQAVLDGTKTDNEILERLRPGYDDIFAALAKAGLAREDTLLAWDFTTATDAAFVEPMQTMVDDALDAVPTMVYVVDDVDNNPTVNALRVVKGTFEVPNYLGEDGYVADPPERNGTYVAEFTMIIPSVAQTAPVPILLFGHGLFGTGRNYLTGPLNLGYFSMLANQFGYAVVATDWVGLSTSDRPALIQGLTDGNLLHVPTEMLRQGVANTAALGRLARDRFPTDADFMDGANALLTDVEVVYWGLSLGGIMGQPLAAYDPDISRAALGVPGGAWGMQIQRSSNWPDFRNVIRQWYPDTLDELKLLQLSQVLFDFTDPMTTAARLLTDPPSGGTKSIVMIEAVCDSQVSNVATETVARTMGIPLTGPTLDPVPFGLQVVTGSVPAALTRYDLGLDPCPGDTNAPVEADNNAHTCVNGQPSALAQVVDLLGTGLVGNRCAGACDCGSCNANNCGCSGDCN